MDDAQSLPPHSIDAEEAVIAAVVLDDDAIARVVPILAPEDFYRDTHRQAFIAALAMSDRGEEITQVTLADEIANLGHQRADEAASWLVQVTGRHFTADGVAAHARIVARDALYRRMAAVGAEIVRTAYAGGPDAATVLAQAEALLLSIRSAEAAGDFQALRDLLNEFLDPVEDDEDARLRAVRSGFMDLDALLGGFKPGDLVIVAARTGVGKSALLLNLARNAAVGQHAVVAFFALEMSGDQLAMRLLAAESEVDPRRVRLGMHNDREEARIMHAVGTLAEAAIYIDDTAVMTVPEIRAKARRLQADAGLDLLVVDYLQLLHGASREAESRAAEIGKITRALKEAARELGVPVIAAAQLSRAVDQRRPPIPMLSDLRESGSIEQDADVVMFIYREDNYRNPEEWQNDNPEAPPGHHPAGLAQIIVAKHRNGPTGVITAHFDAPTVSFRDLALPGMEPPE